MMRQPLTKENSFAIIGIEAGDKDLTEKRKKRRIPIMKKMTMLFCVLLVAALLFILPAPETEAAGHYHNGNTGNEYTAWTSTTSLPTTSGRYYLANDVKLTERWEAPSGKTWLCLNGHTIQQNGYAKSVIKVGAEATLYIEDCSKPQTGKITGGGDLAGVVVGGVFELIGGSISGNSANYGGILVQSGGRCALYGGEVSENTASGSGGGICVQGSGANLQINGENVWIHHNSASYGGGVAAASSGASVNFVNGTISDNSTSGNGGAGIYISDNCSLYMQGGTISGNGAINGYGGGIFLRGRARIMGGSIEGNIADGKGGGIYSIQGDLQITGGAISANEAEEGGGLYSYGSVTFENSRIEEMVSRNMPMSSSIRLMSSMMTSQGRPSRS